MLASTDRTNHLTDASDASAELLGLIATERARTRAQLTAATGLSRSTLAKRLQLLLDAHLISEHDTAPSGGRPSKLLTFNRSTGVAVGVDIGEDHTKVALTDLVPGVLIESTGATDLDAGPEAVLGWVNAEITRLISELGRPSSDIVGICLGVPAPVDWKHGRIVGPSVMHGWDGYDIRAAIRRVHHTTVMIDNDVNLLGLAEYRLHFSDARYMLYVKAGTGIGSAIIVDGEPYRGANGAAGDIGHVHMADAGEPLCRCGNLGCVEALAGGWALARDLRDHGMPVKTARDVAGLAQQGRPEAIQLLRQAGRIVGEATAAAINILDPDVLVLGGVLSRAGDHLATGVRELVYRRCLPLTTTNLRIEISRVDGEHAGVLGAAQLVIDRLLRLTAPPM
ncbi:MAG TPA: ROK family protein [Streptosporangiaceae bacterium]|nr:ROK family protein [Streptosporangiaceae bacterium]